MGLAGRIYGASVTPRRFVPPLTAVGVRTVVAAVVVAVAACSGADPEDHDEAVRTVTELIAEDQALRNVLDGPVPPAGVADATAGGLARSSRDSA